MPFNKATEFSVAFFVVESYGDYTLILLSVSA